MATKIAGSNCIGGRGIRRRGSLGTCLKLMADRYDASAYRVRTKLWVRSLGWLGTGDATAARLLEASRS